MADGRADEETREAGEHTRLTAAAVYEVVRLEGQKELERPLNSLFWSGVAAGLGICASVQGKAFLHMYLPDEKWRPAVEALGYTLGFLLVVLGRLQLFTENTITVVLPLLRRRTWSMLGCTARLWGVVLVANVLGTGLFALLATRAGLSSPEHVAAFVEISVEHFHASPPLEVFARGVPAGFLVAAVVWLLPSAEGSGAFVICALTYLIALGDFTHVIAGSAELLILVFEGELGLGRAAYAFFLPTLLGNILGGTGLFALLAYGQVSEEL